MDRAHLTLKAVTETRQALSDLLAEQATGLRGDINEQTERLPAALYEAGAARAGALLEKYAPQPRGRVVREREGSGTEAALRHAREMRDLSAAWWWDAAEHAWEAEIKRLEELLEAERRNSADLPSPESAAGARGSVNCKRRSCPKCNGKGFTVHEYPTQRVFRDCVCQKRFAAKPRHSPNEKLSDCP